MEEIKHLKALKEKWIVRWENTWEIKEKEYQIQCQSWFNSEESALAFIEDKKLFEKAMAKSLTKKKP